MNRSRPRIALLNAAFEEENNRRNFRRELDADLVEFDANDGQVPPTFEYDAVVVTGSKASVYWDDPWIDGTREYVREAVARGLPVLGVCWGHQLIADALGGEVAAMGEYEIGYRQIDRTDADDAGLFDGIERSFTAFTTHSDEVVAVPDGSEILAENDYSIQSFRVGSAFGVQFHPEYDQETARDVTRGKDLPDERIQAVLDGIHDENYRAACEVKQVFDNFVTYVRNHQSETAAD